MQFTKLRFSINFYAWRNTRWCEMIEMNNINQIQLTRQIDLRFNFLIKACFKWIIIIHFKTQFLMENIKMPNTHKLCQSLFHFHVFRKKN